MNELINIEKQELLIQILPSDDREHVELKLSVEPPLYSPDSVESAGLSPQEKSMQDLAGHIAALVVDSLEGTEVEEE